MSEAEKRSVHTDALQTLGSIIGEGESRDAIHLAVEPAEAGQTLLPGQHVGRMPDGRWGFSIEGKTLGIVDPFIKHRVAPGQRFWLIIYPRQITSLRHVWAHPAFPEQGVNISESEQWIRDFASVIEVGYDYANSEPSIMSYEELMAYAEEWIRTGDEPCLGSTSYQDQRKRFPEFWQHYQRVTGEAVPEDKQEVFFRCAC